MIKKIVIKKVDKKFSQEVKGNLKRSFKFSDGLNIIVGSNGSGKSTLVNCIKQFYNVGENERCSSDVLKEPTTADLSGTIDKKGNLVCIDCQTFFTEDIGHKRMGACVNYDILDVSGAWESNHISSGESKMHAIEYLHKYISSKDWYSEGYDKKHPILLFDEPTLSMDFTVERQFFKYMLEWSAVYQVIVATNSVSCYNLEDANYIELNKGYINENMKAIKEILC